MAKASAKTILSRILFLLYLACICFICFASSGSLPHLSKTFLGFPTDKVVHFLMFLPYPILFYLSFDHKKNGFWPSLGFVFIGIVIGAAIAAGTEYTQGFIPSRGKDISDFYADVIAILCSSLIVLIVDNSKGRRR